MKRILSATLIACAALMALGAGCASNAPKPGTNGTSVYPGGQPYVPPTTPPPSSTDPNGPR